MHRATNDAWPALQYEEFSPTARLLHMGLQAVGKLTLLRPFEPEWANVALALTTRGLATGLVPWQGGAFEVEADLVAHEVRCSTTWGRSGGFALRPMSVADFHRALLGALRGAGVEVSVNTRPQEVPEPVPFDQDTEARPYDRVLAQAWWRVLVSVHEVLERYHARFRGKTQPIGFMWGTFDIRDVRYSGRPVPEAASMGYIRRNAMDEELVEAGWWTGSPTYPRPAFYSFTWPKPAGIEQAALPSKARWDGAMGEFLLDYEDLRAARNPGEELLAFFESSYEAGATRAGWPQGLVGAARPA